MSKSTGVFPEYIWAIYGLSVGVRVWGAESSQCLGFPEALSGMTAWLRMHGLFILLDSSYQLDLQKTKCLEHICFTLHRTNATDL